MSTYCNAYYDQPSLRRSFRSIATLTPLQEAVLEWYNELGPEEQDQFEKMIIHLIQAVKDCEPHISFGPAQALELAGGLIAVEMGWKNGHLSGN